MKKTLLNHNFLTTLNVLTAFIAAGVAAYLLIVADDAFGNDAIICSAIILMSGVFPALSGLYYHRFKGSNVFGYIPMSIVTLLTTPYVLVSSIYILVIIQKDVPIDNASTGLALMLPLYSFVIMIEAGLLGALIVVIRKMLAKFWSWTTSKKA